MYGWFHRNEEVRKPRSESWECIARPDGTVAVIDNLGAWQEQLCDPDTVQDILLEDDDG